MSNIPSIIKEAELSLKKLDGMIDAEDHSKLKAAVDELGASFRKRAYGYSLNELYTVATLLKSKKITADELAEGLKNYEKAVEMVLKHINEPFIKDPKINVTVALDGTENVDEIEAKIMIETDKELERLSKHKQPSYILQFADVSEQYVKSLICHHGAVDPELKQMFDRMLSAIKDFSKINE